MAKIGAIFDVDRTLVRGPTEQLFFYYLIRRGQLSWRKALAFLSRLALAPQCRFQNKSYLQDQPIEEIARLARGCYEEIIAPRLSPNGRDCIRQHQGQGHQIAILTGSLYCLMLPLQEDLQADWLIATRLATENNHYTGEIKGLHPRGMNKLYLLQDLARSQGLDLAQCYAYGDHIQDVPLFLNVGHPVVVNPSWRLQRLARRYHWPIRDF